MSNEIIRIENLTKSYEKVTPFENVSLTVNKGDVISIIGPSGTGKSTLIRCINLLEKPTGGKVFIDGEEITAAGANVTGIRNKMGMVFQSFNLFPHLSVIENVIMAPHDQLKLSKQEAYDRSISLLETVGMREKAFEYPDSLSGGQKQRVAIARSLAMEPEILLLDEPTSALDPERVEEVKAVIYDLAKKGITMLIVTHEMNFARNVSNRVLYMDEGGIYEEGTPEDIFEHPHKEKTRLFVNQAHICNFDVKSSHFDYYDALGLLERLCRSNRVSASIQNKVSVVLEEIIVNLIMKGIKENPDIVPDYHFELECGANDHFSMKVSCSEENSCVFKAQDDLVTKVISSIAKKIDIETNDGLYVAILSSFK